MGVTTLAFSQLPSVVIPAASTEAATAPPAASPSATPAAALGIVQAPAAPDHAGCDFFTAQEIEREYTFEHARADLSLQRAQENNDHVFRLDHDRKAYDARAGAAAADHAATIAALDRRLGAAQAACDPGLVF